MPELPEVETTRLKLEPLLVGRQIVELSEIVPRPDFPNKYPQLVKAAGQQIVSLGRRGKYLIAQLTGSLEWVTHLGMTGGFRLEQGKHSRVRVALDQGEIFFDDIRRFGKMAVVTAGDYSIFPTLAQMGPEPLSPDFELATFVAEAASCGAVKPWLLSQKPVAGLGNIYVDESLWQAQIHPAQTKLSAQQAAKLHTAIGEILAKAIAAGGSTLSDKTYQQHDGLSGLFQLQHKVYARAGQSCERCGQAIQRVVIAQRGTHFCPNCQTILNEVV